MAECSRKLKCVLSTLVCLSIMVAGAAIAKISPQSCPGCGFGGVSTVGPSGGPGGSPFEDRPSPDLEVAELKIWGGDFIDAVQFIYRKKSDPNQLVPAEKHGGPLAVR